MITGLILNLSSWLLMALLPVSVFIFWTSLDYVSFAWSLKESSAQPGGLPGVFVIKTLIPMMALLLCLQGISEVFKGIISLREVSS